MKYPENQRGIILTSIISKVYVKLLKNSVTKYLKNVGPLQAGCETDRSTANKTFFYVDILIMQYILASLFIWFCTITNNVSTLYG